MTEEWVEFDVHVSCLRDFSRVCKRKTLSKWTVYTTFASLSPSLYCFHYTVHTHTHARVYTWRSVCRSPTQVFASSSSSFRLLTSFDCRLPRRLHFVHGGGGVVFTPFTPMADVHRLDCPKTIKQLWQKLWWMRRRRRRCLRPRKLSFAQADAHIHERAMRWKYV